MEKNFLSIYNNKIEEYENLIKTDPENNQKHTYEMAEYMLKCMPFITQYATQETDVTIMPTLETILNSDKHEKVGLQKKQILIDYFHTMDSKKTYDSNKPPTNKKHNRGSLPELICDKCNSKNIYTDEEKSDTICHDCGHCEHIQMEGILTYKEEQEVQKVFEYFYKRENHFNEWINQFQARETTNIPNEVIEQLKADFKKNKIKDLIEITQTKVKSCLKKLNCSKYYEHVPYITNLLNGIKPPKMSQELEDKLRLMFQQIQDPFDKNCPKKRKNFLSYSYVLYKFCELLSEDVYLPCFPLLKSKEKLYQQDVIWRKICNELQWEFIATN